MVKKDKRNTTIEASMKSYLFTTSLFPIAIHWDPSDINNITGITLYPEILQSETTVPKPLQETIQGIRDYTVDSTVSIPLNTFDFRSVSSFALKVYKTLVTIPVGKVITYGNLASLAGFPGAARALGSAMANNPWPLAIPCHRVIPSSGKPGNFGSGPEVKIVLLNHEGVRLNSSGTIEESHYF